MSAGTKKNEPDTVLRTFLQLERFGNQLVAAFHLLGLFVIGAAVLWASWSEVFAIVGRGGPTVQDVLLLFIYLELGAMVGIYFKTNHLPVRFLLYIAITALTRELAVDATHMNNLELLTVTGAILILAIAILVVRIASHRYPSSGDKN
ncbi:MAG: phosphate-starvation-inducible PsiE family protein [Gammaproteobacteria bacterium]|jgi:phosphate starvation-inducible membrane PsiE|nr:phosphate-starvation-inducible PsiE family protein [Gammaproteobacteria bacterium]